MTSDLTIKLIHAARTGDLERVDQIARLMAEHARGSGKSLVAQRIEAVLKTTRPQQAALCAVKETGGVLVEQEPRATLDGLYLQQPVRMAVIELAEEHEHAARLRENGLEPRNRVLLTGPPGNGKTSLAEAIAGKLGVPFYPVSYTALIGSYLGETPARLQKAFEFVKNRPCVLFLDEFDTVGKERGGEDVGEMHRVTSILLLQIDRMPSNVVCVVATNHPEMLDRAVWRRFQIRLEMGPPTREQTEKILGGVPGKYVWEGIENFSDAVMLSEHYRRRLLITENESQATQETFEWWLARNVAGLKN